MPRGEIALKENGNSFKLIKIPKEFAKHDRQD